MDNSRKLLRKRMVEHSGVEPLASTMPWLSKQNELGSKNEPESLSTSKKYLIPAGFTLVPGIEWSGGRPRIFHILCENVTARREKVVNTRRAKKRA